MKKLVFILVIFPLLANAHPGVGIVMDKKGNVFYTDLKQIWKIDVNGTKSVAVKNVHSHELYIDGADNLFGEHLWYEENKDKWGHYVWKFSATGQLTKVIPETEGFLSDYSFVRDHHGNMFTADRTGGCQHIVSKKTDGSAKVIDDSCMENIRWMTVDKEGAIYLVDLHDIKKVDTSGHVETLARAIPGECDKEDIHALMGISIDRHKNVYVSDHTARSVKKIQPSGKVSVVAKTKFPWSPSGQLVAPNGDYWLLECSPTNAVRVERIRSSGERTIF